MKNILITGGAGFVGSNLCKYLIDSGEKVFCLDNLYTGNINNIKDLLSHPNFAFIHHNIINGNLLRKIDYPISEIYNLACPASPPHYQKDGLYTLKTCTTGLYNIIDFAKIYNARVLQASTSEVYGNPLEHPQAEEYWGNVNPIGIRSCYDEGKRCAESILVNSKINYIIVRIFNTYGLNMDKNDGRVVSNFVIQALQNKDITIYGDGSQTRSFCYVSDLVEGLVKAMNSGVNDIINIGNPTELNLLELAELIIKYTNSKSKIVFYPLPLDDPIKRKPSIDKAKDILLWEPKVSLAEGIQKTIEYFKSIIK